MKAKTASVNQVALKQRDRRQNGAGIMVIVFMLAFVILLVIGLFSYEVSRVTAARDELRSACEAASLAGAAALASSNETNPTNSHNLARDAAQQAFVTNSILGTLLANTTFSDSQTSNATTAAAQDPANNAATMYVEFLKQDGTVAAWNDALGRTVHVVAVFGEQPSFGFIMNILHVPVTATAKARVPQMDIVMCFDVSGSIDDQTKVTFVRRRLNGGNIVYESVKNGTIYTTMSAGPTGTSLNAEAPQRLDQAYTINFDKTVRSAGADTGTLPGGSATVLGGRPNFTDLVVNVDGNSTFTPPYTMTDPVTGASYPVPSLGALVEIARGNCETSALYTSSGAQAALGTSVTPTVGYKQCYDRVAHNLTQPIGAARQAAINFFKIMNNNTDATFGLVSFDNPAPEGPGISPTQTHDLQERISYGYAAGGLFNPPYPGQALGANNFNTIVNNVIPLTVANGCTCMGNALEEAVNELVASGRPGTRKAVIMFTDGQPTCTSPPYSWLPAATLANTKGIAIYTVGLAQNSAIIPAECTNLNDGRNKPVTYVDPILGPPARTYTPTQDGMAAVAGNGGKFFLVTNSANLNFVFENIARQLVQLSKDQ